MHRWLDERASALVVAVVALPFVVVALATIGLEWYPGGDIALGIIQANEVGGARTPLTGAYSRWGWDHPGPLLVWLHAPFARLFGPTGVLIGTALLNGTAAAGTLLVALRRGGRTLAVLCALGLLVLCTALGPARLIDPWNPWAAVLAFMTFVVLAWAVGDGDLAMAPWLVATGTLVVHAHAGYAVVVLGLIGVSALLAWRVRAVASDRAASAPVGRSLALALTVGVVLWLPPVLQQLTADEGNLGALVTFARDPTEPVAGWRTAWGVLGAELGLPGAWLAGGDDGPFGIPPASTLPALALLAIVAGAGALAARRGAPAAGRLAVVVISTAGLGVISTARVTGPVYNYVVRWWWVVAAMVWVSLLWSVLTLLPSVGLRRAMSGVALVVTGVLGVLLAWRAVPSPVPEPYHSAAVAELGPDVAAVLEPDTEYLVEWIDRRGLGGVGTGLVLELGERGFDVAVPAAYQPAFEAWQTAGSDDVEATLLVVGNDDLDAGYRPPDGAIEVAAHDPLDPTERARADELAAEITRRLEGRGDFSAVAVDDGFGRAELRSAGIDDEAITELAELRAAGSAYDIYLVAP